MRQWPARPSMALLRSPQMAECAAASISNPLRNFHLSAIRCEDSPNSSKPPPRQDRLQRSQAALAQLKNLNSNSSSHSPPLSGLRGGTFKGGSRAPTTATATTTPAPSSSPLVKRVTVSGSPTSYAGGSKPPAGAIIARRSPSSNGFTPQRFGNNRPGGPPNRGGNRNNRGGNRPDRRGGGGRGRDSKPGGAKEASEAEQVDEDADGSEDLPDGLVRHLLAENEKYHGEREYNPHAQTAAELLAWTDSQLPPLEGSNPSAILAKHLDATVTHRTVYAPTPTADPMKQDVRRLIAGEMVRFTKEEDQKFAVIAANEKKLQKARTDVAEALGLDPAASIEFAELPEQLRRETERRVVAGGYERVVKEDAKDFRQKTMDAVLLRLQSNGTYRPANTAQFLNAVEGLLEGKPRPMAPQIKRG